MSAVDLQALAALPELVAQLQADIAELRQRLTVAERRALTVKQAAVALGVSEKTVRRQCAAGKLQHRRIGSRLTVYLPAC